MIAAHGKVESACIGIPATFDFANAPPLNRGRISVLFIAGNDAAFAADALAHIEVEAILFAFVWFTVGDSLIGRERDLVEAIWFGLQRGCQDESNAVFARTLYEWQRHE
jgi:hypothetical protein